VFYFSALGKHPPNTANKQQSQGLEQWATDDRKAGGIKGSLRQFMTRKCADQSDKRD